MNPMQQLQTEIRELNDQITAIEKAYPEGILSDDAMTMLEGHNEALGQKTVELAGLQERQQRANAIFQTAKGVESTLPGQPPVPTYGPAAEPQREYKTFGQMYVESAEYKTRLAAGAFDGGNGFTQFDQVFQGYSAYGASLEMKTAGDLIHTARTGFLASGGPFESIVRSPRIVELLYPDRDLSSLFPHEAITEEILEVVREKTFTNNADMIAEASALTGTSGEKPASDFDFETDTMVVKDLAHWMAVTNKMMRQSNLRSLIDSRLMLGLDLKVADQIINGDGSTLQLEGLLATSVGIQITGMGSDNPFDAIHKGITMVRVTGHSRVNFLAIHPILWQIIRLTRENAATATKGGYLFGPPSMAAANMIWGYPLTLTEQLATGTVIAGDSAQATVFDRERTGVKSGWVDRQFTRNMQTLLAEMALGFYVWRPASFVQITGLS